MLPETVQVRTNWLTYWWAVITGSAPRMGFFIFLVLGFQVVLLGAYVMYRRRRDTPKKYL